MKLTLDAAEISRAIQHYAAGKGVATKADELTVTIHWTGRTADVERKKIPTLTDKVGDK